MVNNSGNRLEIKASHSSNESILISYCDYLKARFWSDFYFHCVIKLKPHSEESDVCEEGGDLGALERPQGHVIGHGETGQGQTATHILLVPGVDAESEQEWDRINTLTKNIRCLFTSFQYKSWLMALKKKKN